MITETDKFVKEFYLKNLDPVEVEQVLELDKIKGAKTNYNNDKFVKKDVSIYNFIDKEKKGASYTNRDTRTITFQKDEAITRLIIYDTNTTTPQSRISVSTKEFEDKLVVYEIKKLEQGYVAKFQKVITNRGAGEPANLKPLNKELYFN